jgi:hypothetical protein
MRGRALVVTAQQFTNKDSSWLLKMPCKNVTVAIRTPRGLGYGYRGVIACAPSAGFYAPAEGDGGAKLLD